MQPHFLEWVKLSGPHIQISHDPEKHHRNSERTSLLFPQQQKRLLLQSSSGSPAPSPLAMALVSPSSQPRSGGRGERKGFPTPAPSKSLGICHLCSNTPAPELPRVLSALGTCCRPAAIPLLTGALGKGHYRNPGLKIQTVSSMSSSLQCRKKTTPLIK